MKTIGITHIPYSLWVIGATVVLLASGCASMNTPAYNFADLERPFLRDGYMAGPPRVENCGIIAISTPSAFECNGKKYTTFELADIRESKPPPPPLKVTPSVPRGGIQ